MGNLFCLCKEDNVIMNSSMQGSKNQENYQEKYLDKFENMDDTNANNTYENNYILEYTSHGNVVMKYDTDAKHFLYYSDRQVPNNILEVVSRKYVVQYHCKHIYHEEVKEDTDDESEETKSSTKELPDVYGKFKVKQKKRVVEKSNINRYKHLGKFKDFYILQKVNKKEPSHISYEDFMASLNNENK